MRSPQLAIGVVIGMCIGVGMGALLFTEDPREAALRPATRSGDDGKTVAALEGELKGAWDVSVRDGKIELKSPFHVHVIDAPSGKLEIERLEGHFEERHVFAGTGGQRWKDASGTATGRPPSFIHVILTWRTAPDGTLETTLTDAANGVWLPQ